MIHCRVRHALGNTGNAFTKPGADKEVKSLSDDAGSPTLQISGKFMFIDFYNHNRVLFKF